MICVSHPDPALEALAERGPQLNILSMERHHWQIALIGQASPLGSRWWTMRGQGLTLLSTSANFRISLLSVPLFLPAACTKIQNLK